MGKSLVSCFFWLTVYFETTWISGDFALSLRSHFDHCGPRTTNLAEGFHNSMNTCFGIPHPSTRPSSIGYKNVSLKYSVVRSNWLEQGHQNNACLPTSRWKPTLHQPSSTTVSRLAECSHTLSLIQQPGRCFTLLHIRIWRTFRIWLAFNVTFKVRTLTDMDSQNYTCI